MRNSEQTPIHVGLGRLCVLVLPIDLAVIAEKARLTFRFQTPSRIARLTAITMDTQTFSKEKNRSIKLLSAASSKFHRHLALEEWFQTMQRFCVSDIIHPFHIDSQREVFERPVRLFDPRPPLKDYPYTKRVTCTSFNPWFILPWS